MQTDDEEGGGSGGVGGSNTSPPNSQTSSVDGVTSGPDTKSSHPFRIIEHDTLSLQSMTSLGRVGRLLSGIQDAGNF